MIKSCSKNNNEIMSSKLRKKPEKYERPFVMEVMSLKIPDKSEPKML